METFVGPVSDSLKDLMAKMGYDSYRTWKGAFFREGTINNFIERTESFSNLKLPKSIEDELNAILSELSMEQLVREVTAAERKRHLIREAVENWKTHQRSVTTSFQLPTIHPSTTSRNG
jgi:hypothetical protein